MATNPAEILAAGQALVPNTVNQDIQHQMAHLQLQGASLQNQAAAQQLRMQQIALQRQQSFGGDMAAYLQHPSAEGIANLFGHYPEFAAPLKDAYAAMDEQRRRSDTTQIGSAASLAAKGDYTGAANLIKSRIAADTAAGHDSSTDQALYDHLTSNDPAQQKAALGMMTIALGAAVGPEHAADFLKANGMDRAPVSLGMDQRLVDPTTGQPIVNATPKLENVSRTLATGETANTAFNPYTGTYGAAAAQGAAPADAAGTPPPVGASAGANGSRADRNNNPGNLRAINPSTGKPVPWVTSLPGYQGADPQGYAIFAPGTATGTSAQQALLGRYFGQGRNTVSSIVEHWAPRQSRGGDNTDAQVNNYTAYVARQLGVDPNQPLPKTAIPQLAAAMHQFEAGATGHAGTVRVPPATQAAPAPEGAAGAAPAATTGASDPYSFGPASGTAAVNTKGAPAGYAWNADHTAVVPVKGGEQDLSSYPPAMVHDAAVELLTTGQMPSMGMGGAAIKKAILDERSKIMQQAGITADQLPTFRARYGADKTALQNITGIESGLHASEAALKPYMDQVLRAQQRLVELRIMDNGLPAGNAANLALWSRLGTGKTKAAITQYRDAINALQTEYAKFMSSASGMSNTPTTDSARNLAGELTDESLGPAAMQGHMQQLQREASIKMGAVTNQRVALEQKLSGYLGGNHAASSPNAPAVPVQVRSVKQYNALPSGTHYLDPNGVHRIKP